MAQDDENKCRVCTMRCLLLQVLRGMHAHCHSGPGCLLAATAQLPASPLKMMSGRPDGAAAASYSCRVAVSSSAHVSAQEHVAPNVAGRRAQGMDARRERHRFSSVDWLSVWQWCCCTRSQRIAHAAHSTSQCMRGCKAATYRVG